RRDPALGRLDPQIDRTVGAIFRLAEEAATTLSGPLAKGARALVEHLFPEGAAAIVKTSFVEQVSAVDRLLEGLGEHERIAADIGLAPYVQRLRALNAEFRAALTVEPRPAATR